MKLSEWDYVLAKHFCAPSINLAFENSEEKGTSELERLDLITDTLKKGFVIIFVKDI